MLFLVASLAVVQLGTMVILYGVARSALIDTGKQQLVTSAQSFSRHLDTLAGHLAEDAKIMSLDYALRQSIAAHDSGTAISALRNFGRRVGASRMLLIDLDGTIAADTARPRELTGLGRFAFPDLLPLAGESGRAAASGVVDGVPYRLVVVPVLLPDPIAWICILVRVDDRFAEELRALSPLRKDIALAGQTAPDAPWSVVASAGDPMDPLAGIAAPGQLAAAEPQLLTKHGAEYLVLTTPIPTAPGSLPMMAVLQYPLDEALAPYRKIMLYMGALMAGGLVAALIGIGLIARGVTRPVTALAAVARRIADGDYTPLPPVRTSDEIGQLTTALDDMAQAIADREEHIRHQSLHDAVTGLPNRLNLEEQVDQAIDQGHGVALLLLGLDRLREVTNTLGHDLADRVARDAGDRLARALAANGAGDAVIARVSEHGFAILLVDRAAAAAQALAPALVAAFDAPYTEAPYGEAPYGEAEVTVDLAAGVGIAVYPDPTPGAPPSDTASILLRHADVAMLNARAAEPYVRLYDHAADPHRPERLSLMGDLKIAIEQDALELAYQPKLEPQTGRVVGAEALVRWTHPRRGFVPPDSFIPLAEETGAIRHLTRWGLRRALRQSATWAAAGHDLRMSVNLSVRDLGDASLPDRIDALLAETGLKPDRLMLEITESAIMGEPEAAIAMLRRLADRGVELSIDDFGVGQSSFAYLRRLPVREIKIDRSFVKALDETVEDQAIVRSIIELGHNLGYKVTAEGVENAGSLALLAEMGCDLAQGYYIARPLMPGAFNDFLASHAAGEIPWQATLREAHA
ncbi:putative bifunctional diguanylate cyclase/phosphodiesterase [Nitrospirillum amazonense]|uniref:putative bifunctional diguanylate cyclase/phosphodiesterase n=1 Tax=Nitrospirillum amazonense TaxID=28077 RepID=UPI0011A633AB|nr:EAL domain-containing protein [Nitrospirillum amazonense]